MRPRFGRGPATADADRPGRARDPGEGASSGSCGDGSHVPYGFPRAKPDPSRGGAAISSQRARRPRSVVAGAPDLRLEQARRLGARGGHGAALRGRAEPLTRAVGHAPPARARRGRGRVGALGQQLVSPHRRERLQLAVEHPGVLPALPASRRRGWAACSPTASCSPGSRLARRVRRRVRPPPPARARAPGLPRRRPLRALPRALSDVVLPRRRLRGVPLPRSSRSGRSCSPSAAGSGGRQ